MRVRGTLVESVAGLALAASAISAALTLSAIVPSTFAQQTTNPLPGSSALRTLLQYEGMMVRNIELRGVEPDDVDKLRQMIAPKAGEPLDRAKLRQSIQTLYDTGRFSDIEVQAERAADHQVDLIFVTTPSYFVGEINVDGAPGRPSSTQIINASKLQLGELFTREKMDRALKRIQDLMQGEGYYRAQLSDEEQPNPQTQQVAIRFKISPGEQAHVGNVNVTGKPGYAPSEIRDIADLHSGDNVSSDRLTRALQRLRKKYQKQNRLLAQVLVEQAYRREGNAVDYTLNIDPGPVIEIAVEGFRLRRAVIKKDVPVYQENALDDDLLNEGRRNLLDYLQTGGYFEAKVGIKKEGPNPDLLRVIYVIDAGPVHKLVRVAIAGNKYFAADLLRARMQVQPAGRLLSHGRYNQSLLNSDIRGLEELYRANGFAQVKITANVIDNYQGVENQLGVDVQVEEGPQTLVGTLHIAGNSKISGDQLRPLLSTVEGQPFSDFNVSNDRDAILNYYFNHGFPDATFQASAKPIAGHTDRIDVTFTIHEGQQIFVDDVLVSGLNYTRPGIVQRQLQVRSGVPVSQLDMLETQRRLYDLGIFNQVDTAIQNPEGKEPDKNVLVNVREAKRYTFNYGLGLEAQTGQPAGAATPAGRTGVSPRVSFDVTRINFRGRDTTISFKSHVGRLQQRGLLSYQEPHLFNLDNLSLSFNALYANTLDVSTFTSKRLEGSVEAQQVVSRATKLYYRFAYRQVQATRFAPNFSINEAPLLSLPTRVGMPTLSYIRDARDNPLESAKGNYSTFDTGIASSYFGSQADFSRLLLKNSTYYRIKKKYVFARSTSIGVETPFRKTVILSPLEAFLLPPGSRVRQIPLPERFFSGGGNSLRGFGLNQAGPRDLNSGFPLGGSALFINNLELRLPPVTLPFFQDNLSFALFHDAGNVFDTSHDMVHSLLRWRQRSPQLCVQASTFPQCDFNYVSHAVGVGIRYKTPIGPVRFDLGYNLNPPAFPSCQTTPSSVGEGTSTSCPTSSPFFKPQHLGHFNVYFSVGQTF